MWAVEGYKVIVATRVKHLMLDCQFARIRQSACGYPSLAVDNWIASVASIFGRCRRAPLTVYGTGCIDDISTSRSRPTSFSSHQTMSGYSRFNLSTKPLCWIIITWQEESCSHRTRRLCFLFLCSLFAHWQYSSPLILSARYPLQILSCRLFVSFPTSFLQF